MIWAVTVKLRLSLDSVEEDATLMTSTFPFSRLNFRHLLRFQLRHNKEVVKNSVILKLAGVVPGLELAQIGSNSWLSKKNACRISSRVFIIT